MDETLEELRNRVRKEYKYMPVFMRERLKDYLNGSENDLTSEINIEMVLREWEDEYFRYTSNPSPIITEIGEDNYYDFIPDNVCFENVPPSFLNFIAKDVEITHSYLIGRYGEGYGKNYPKEHIDNFKEILVNNEINKGIYGGIRLLDVVAMFGETEEDYYLFYYDPDISDCIVGRTNKVKDNKIVDKNKFIKDHINGFGEEDGLSVTELPIPTKKVKF